MSPKQPTDSSPRTESGYYEPYSDFHKNVRLWFLAYGIGAPVFLVQFPGALDTLRALGLLRVITVLFLAGVVIQILAALIYKTAMWYLYMRELGYLAKTTKRVKVSEWLSIAYWLEFSFDVLTLVLFVSASWLTLSSVT